MRNIFVITSRELFSYFGSSLGYILAAIFVAMSAGLTFYFGHFFDRGVAAWKVGHKPGTTPAQWGMARVNSFITKGKVWYKHDSDLAKQV